MILEPPLCISPSPLPALQIGAGWLELAGPKRFRVLLNGVEYPLGDYSPGLSARGDLRLQFAEICSFLSYYGEELEVDLPAVVLDWCRLNADELRVAECELEGIEAGQ